MLPLQQLATDKFGPLTDAELKLLEAVASGRSAKCGSANEQENDPNNAAAWGDERTIRSSIVKWLCRDKNALTYNDSLVIAVRDARFTGQLDLSASSLGLTLSLLRCAVPDGINLAEARLRKLDLGGTVCGNLIAWGLTVEGSLFIRYGFRSHGPVVLTGASVHGDLECIDAHLGEPTSSPVLPVKGLQPHIILWADRISVGGQVSLLKTNAVGIVSLSDANISSRLDCTDAKISLALIMRDAQLRSANFQGCHCPYLVADRIVVKGSFFLRRGFQSVGSVVLLNCSITGDLDCNGSFFGSQMPDTEIRAQTEMFGKLPDAALSLNGSTVGGYVYLGRNFQAHGLVNLNGVTVGANLICNDGHFSNEGQLAFTCQFSQIRGAVLCRSIQTTGQLDFFGTTVTGSVSFTGAEFRGPGSNGVKYQNAKIGGALRWRQVVVSPNTALNLSHLRVGQLEDDDQSWPAKGMLVLDGFQYDAIANVPLDTRKRKGWLKSHLEYLKRQTPDEFTLQPHRQLADILRKSGYEDNARDVLIDMHIARREQGGFSKFGWLWSWILQGTLGFGYRSHRTLLWGLGLVILGAALFNTAYRAGSLVPPKPDAQNVSKFSAIGYSLDSFLPIINLHQEELWVPTGAGRAGWIQYYYWFHICLGWALITLGVAGFTGLVRKE